MKIYITVWSINTPDCAGVKEVEVFHSPIAANAHMQVWADDFTVAGTFADVNQPKERYVADTDGNWESITIYEKEI